MPALSTIFAQLSPLSGTSPMDRLVRGGGGAALGALLGRAVGGRKTAGVLSLIGGGVGAFAPDLFKLFDKANPLKDQIDASLGVVPAIKNAIFSSDRATSGSVALAQRLARSGNRARALRILRAEQQRLADSQIKPIFSFLF